MIEFINKYLFGTAVPFLLIFCGIYFCFELKFFHFRKFGRIINILTKRNTEKGTSPLKAVSLALAGTLGVGNIVGVSAAIAMGGFGAIFWMWISAFCAMLLKYAEIVLAMLYRHFDKNGTPHGSAMFYIKACFQKRGWKRLGSATAGIFAVFCLVNSLTMGSTVQMNAVGNALSGVFHIPAPLTCGLLALVTLAVLFSGRNGILKFTEMLVPIMTLGYIILSVAVFIMRADRIDDAFVLIFKSAFTKSSAVSGIGGYILSAAIRYGVMRGVVSNEAGCGTAPAAHAVSNCKHPAEQGVWGMLEVFADTRVLCTMTALVVIIGYDSAALYENDFMMMTISAYGSVLGEYASVFLAIAVLFFGFATVLCWAHYGMECAEYFSKKRTARTLFIFAYCASVFLGAFISSNAMWQITDFAVGGMTVINLLVLILMSGEIKKETQDYFKI
jgi:AGCS family alanine or glycine:cation symporter